MNEAVKLREMQNGYRESQKPQNMNLPPSKSKLPTKTANTLVNASAAHRYSGGHDTKYRSSNANQHAAGPSSSTLTGYVIRNNSSAQKRDQSDPSPITEHYKLHEKFQNEQKSRSKKLEVQEEKTSDKATQTDEEYHQTPLQKMDAIISVLCAKLDRLKTQTHILDSQVANKRQHNCSSSDNIENNDLTHSKTNYVPANTVPSEDSLPTTKDSEYETGEDEKDSEQQSITCSNSNDEISPMVPIGNGNAIVPLSVLSEIDWSSYSTATCRLMNAVFSKKILVTSSLTGRRPPNYPRRPAKKPLNPALVKDIIKTVVAKCKVQENTVRLVMARKCSNERCWFLNRIQKKRSLSAKKNAHLRFTGSVESTSTSFPHSGTMSYSSSSNVPSEDSLPTTKYSEYETGEDEKDNEQQSITCSNSNDEISPMVPIGNGNAVVPLSVLSEIDWSSYSTATSKLMNAVFSKKILATSSLTGKQPPYGPGRPGRIAKKQLNPDLVNDIIKTVVEKCKVQENAVRLVMSRKCSKETWWFLNPYQKKRPLSTKKNAHLRFTGSVESTSTSFPHYSSSSNVSSEPSDEDSEYKTSEGDKNKEKETTGLLCKVADNPPTMVPIGKGNAVVPSSVLSLVDWSSHTSATRTLMLAVFSEKVIATSCLSGKARSSAGSPLKPRKKQLNPAMVDDIVQTVVERCNVEEKIVRLTMAVKCSDESKVLRDRRRRRGHNKLLYGWGRLQDKMLRLSRRLNKKRTPLKKNSPSRSLGSAESSDNKQN